MQEDDMNMARSNGGINKELYHTVTKPCYSVTLRDEAKVTKGGYGGMIAYDATRKEYGRCREMPNGSLFVTLGAYHYLIDQSDILTKIKSGTYKTVAKKEGN
jgi:deoxyxylulose-5-phosphate synthase